MNSTTPMSERQPPSLATVLIAVGVAFMCIAYVSYLRPESRVNNEFVETQCTIMNKRLMVHQGKSGPTYRPEFEIRYRAGDEWYETWTYSIHDKTTSSREENEELLERFEMGQNYPCWYDPYNPGEAVLVRGYGFFGMILAAFGAIVALIGLVSLL